jgi:large subunit ribosomal protein L22
MIRGKNAAESAVILQFSTREASKAVLKVLNSAVANAVQKGATGPETLLVAQAYVDEGPILKRWKPRARGSASRINKRTSHITLILNQTEETPQPKATKAPQAAAKAKVDKTAAAKSAAAKTAAEKLATKKPEKKAVKPKAKITETKAKDAVSKEDTSGSES